MKLKPLQHAQQAAAGCHTLTTSSSHELQDTGALTALVLAFMRSKSIVYQDECVSCLAPGCKVPDMHAPALLAGAQLRGYRA